MLFIYFSPKLCKAETQCFYTPFKLNPTLFFSKSILITSTLAKYWFTLNTSKGCLMKYSEYRGRVNVIVSSAPSQYSNKHYTPNFILLKPLRRKCDSNTYFLTWWVKTHPTTPSDETPPQHVLSLLKYDNR